MLAALLTSEIATLSPMSYGRRTRMNRIPSKYFELADPIINAKARIMLLKLRKRARGLNPLAAKMTQTRMMKKAQFIIFSKA